MSNFLLSKRIFNTRQIFCWAIFAAMPAMLFCAVSLEVMTSAGFSLKDIPRDPAQQTGQSSFLGFLSNVGVWLWVCSASICLFSAAIGGFVAEQKNSFSS